MSRCQGYCHLSVFFLRNRVTLTEGSWTQSAAVSEERRERSQLQLPECTTVIVQSESFRQCRWPGEVRGLVWIRSAASVTKLQHTSCFYFHRKFKHLNSKRETLNKLIWTRTKTRTGPEAVTHCTDSVTLFCPGNFPGNFPGGNRPIE